jgi:beta-aspartyl-peptidase (threonine type)
MKPQPVIVVHGGAGRITADQRGAFLRGIEDALERGVEALRSGAVAAVREAVMSMEACDVMNAGRGAALDAEGNISLDAGFMEGATRRFGGVAGVTCTMHPVLLAQHLASRGHFGQLLGAPASDELAEHLDVPLCKPEDLIVRRAGTAREGMDTVGAIALDADGHIAAALSTGGIAGKAPGRIGDSPIVGAGYWADDGDGGCVTSGVGEVLMREGTARRCIRLASSGLGATDAAAAALAGTVDYEGDQRGPCGLILLTADGRFTINHTSEAMPAGWAGIDGNSEVRDVWSRIIAEER